MKKCQIREVTLTISSQRLKGIVLYIVIAFLLVGCNCPQSETVIIHDTIFHCNASIFDSLKSLAIKEVDEYRAAAIYQVDTMRANLIKEYNLRNNEIIEGRYRDNMYIDTIYGPADVVFDSLTGKPKIIIR